MPELEIDFLDSYDNEAILSELRRIAHMTGKHSVTKADLRTRGRVSYELVTKRFGSLRKALECAGLTPQRYTKASEEELLAMLVNLWEMTVEKDGRRPLRGDLKAYGFPVSSDTYVRRFGTWKKALKQAYESVHQGEVPQLHSGSHVTSNAADPPANGSRSISLRKRFFVMKRDEFTCTLCGASGRGVRLEVDHKVPRAKGGTDDLDNLQTLCFNCNRGKRDSLE
jgi:hypothetical protein